MVMVSVMTSIGLDAWTPVWKLIMVKFVKGLFTNCSRPISYWTCLFVYLLLCSLLCVFLRKTFICVLYLPLHVPPFISLCYRVNCGLRHLSTYIHCVWTVCMLIPIFLTFLLGPVYTGHFMRFWSGSYPIIKRPKCKCSLKCFRGGFESDRSNHFRRWSGMHSWWNWTSVNASGCWNHICRFYSSQNVKIINVWEHVIGYMTCYNQIWQC